ncbi:hypothetical protein [Shewanella sp. 125m-1]
MHLQLWISPVLVTIGLLFLSVNTQATTKTTTAIDKPAITINLNKYLGGSQGKLKEKSALIFKFGNGSANNTCSIITTDNYLRHAKNRLENINLSESNFYFDCLWNGTYYFLSNRVRTYAEVIIKQPDSQFPMSMHIEAKLVSLTGEQANIISGDISLRNTLN